MKNTMTSVLNRAGAYFSNESSIHQAARRFATASNELKIPFAFAGTLAVNAFGHIRTTDTVTVLLTPQGLAEFKQRWLVRGWIEKFPNSKGMRDTQCDVNIDVLLSGGFPGDGLPKPIQFPEPNEVAERSADGFPVLALRTLIELKLASGMTAPHRPRDLDDVIQLIRANQLAADYAASLNPYVQNKFTELWHAAQHNEDY